MPLSYYEASLTIAQAPSLQLREDYQQVIDAEWEVASSLYEIKEELVFGTQEFTETSVRLNHAISALTGKKLGDDYRQIKFRDFDHAKGLGYRYEFDNNTWLCVNSDLYKFVTASTTVRRCNNAIKYYNENGALINEPCIIGESYTGTMIDYDQVINIPSGELVVTVQYNQNTNKIQINDRFLFGGQAYKVKAINNFFQNATGDQTSIPLLYLQVYKDSIADGDDKVNNIPVSDFNYTITLNTNVISQSIGYTTQLIPTIKLNDEIVVRDVTFESDDTAIATADALGNIELLSDGNCNIKVSMTDNPNIFSTCNIEVLTVPVLINEVRISPNITEILQGDTVTYTCQLYVNGVLTPSTFSFAASGAPISNYNLTSIDGNTFSVENIRLYTKDDLIVTCNDGLNIGTQSISLKGAW